MKDFTFDLLRFDGDDTTATVSTYNEFKTALDNTSITTIKLSADITGQAFTIATGRNITLDFNGKTYTVSSGSINLAASSNVTFTDGTISSSQNISNSGTLKIDNMTLSGNGYLTSISNGGVTVTGANTLKISSGSDTYTLENGVKIKSTAGSMTLQTSEDKTATVTLINSSSSFTDSTASPATICTGQNMTFAYSKSGELSVTDLANNCTFSISTSTNDKVTYSVKGNGMLATAADGTTKIWSGDEITQSSSLTTTNLATENNYTSAFTISDAKLTISKSALKVMSGTEALIVDESDFSTTYGKIIKVDETSYKLEKTDSGDNELDGGITISDGLTVQFAEGFNGTTITVSSTVFKTTGDNAYTVSGSEQVSVNGSTAVSLQSGTIITSVEAQSITAGDYTVSGYKSGNDGITVSLSGSNVVVGDIDAGESVKVGSTEYYRDDLGLRTGTNKIYTGDVTVTSYGDGFAVNLDNLEDGFSTFIQPNNKTLEIGTTNTIPAVVIDKDPNSTASEITKYAELKVDSVNNAYNLTTVTGGDASAFQGAVDTVSLTSGDVTINKSLIGDEMIIVTSGGAKFIVTASSTTFTVSATDDAPKVEGATALILLDGTITTDTGSQTITIGANTLVVTSSTNGMTVTATTEGLTTTFTVTAAANDSFTLGGKAYTIDSKSDGITFTVTDTGITLNELETTDSDVFTYDGVNYSVRGAGFIKSENGTYSIWTVNNSHSLTGGTLSVESLGTGEHWHGVATVDDDTDSATISALTSSPVTLVGADDFAKTYGTLTKNDGVYQISTVDSTEKLASLQVDGVVSMSNDLTGVTLTSSVATLTVTDDSNDGYQVTLTSGAGAAASVSAGDKVSLIAGTLQADSQVTATVLDSVITAQESTTLTIAANSSDATISNLAQNDSFAIDDAGSYKLTVIGLINDNQQYLLGSKEGTVKLSEIGDTSDTTRWGSLISAGELTITSSTENALIVDDASDPQTLYADYAAASSLLSKSSGGEKWALGNTINIDDTTVKLTADFSGAIIYGRQSKASLTVNENKTFTISDIQTGATLDANNISLTGGTVSLTSTSQTVSTEGGIVKSAKDLTVIVDGENTSIGAIDVNDTFTVNDVKYTDYQVGLMDSSDKLYTGTGFSDTVAVTLLSAEENWSLTAAVKDNVLTLPTSSSANTWVIIDSDKTTQYGSLQSDGTEGVSVDRTDTSFAIKASFSGATFTTDETKFTVTDGTGGATISSEVGTVNQTAGLVALSDVNQSVKAGSNTINFSAQDSSTDAIKVSVSSSAATVTALDTGDSFSVDGVTYTLLDNGRFQRSTDSLMSSGATVSTSGGAVAVNTLLNYNWNGLAEIEIEEGNLVIDNDVIGVFDEYSVTSAFVVKKDNTTTIYGTLTKTTDGYTLSTAGKTSTELTSVTVTPEAAKVTFTNDFQNKTISAGNAATFQSTASGEFTVNFDGTTASVTGTNALTLTSGTLTLTDTSQTVTAGGNTVKAARGTVTVNYDGSSVTVDSLDTANDLVTVNGTTYTLNDATGSGFTITVNDGTTTVSGINNGDIFTIGTNKFTKTSAGFFKVADGSTSYLWTSTDDVKSLDVTRLTGSTDWTAMINATDDDGNLTLSNSTAAGILVDNVSNPTTIYGKLKKSGNAYTLTQLSTSDTLPTTITVGSTVTAIIDSAFNTVPLTLTDATSVTVNDHTVGGTVDKFIPTTMMFTPETGDSFTVDDTAYVKYDAGLTSAGKIWTDATASSYVLPTTSDDVWTAMLTLTDAELLDLSSATLSATEYIIVDNTISTRRAKLDYSDGTYAFTKLDDDAIDTIKLGDGNATVTTDFAAQITTGDGTYTVNKLAYTGDDLTIAATEKTSTLYEGTVTISKDASVTANETITATDGDGITATAAEGNWTAIGGLNSGDKFTVGTTAYEMIADNTLIKSDTQEVFTGAITSGAINYDDLNNFSAYIELDEDDVLDLTEKISAAEALVVANGDPSTIVAKISYDSSSGYTLAETDGEDADKIASVKLGKDVPTFTTALADIIVNTTDETTYTVNSAAFIVYDSSELTILTTTNGAVLTDGTVILSSSTDTVTARRKDSDNIDFDETISGVTTSAVTVKVATEDSTPVITIGSIDDADTFTVGNKKYLKTSIGLIDQTSTDAKKLFELDDTTVTTAALDVEDDWLNVVEVTNGALEINSSTAGDIVFADISTPKSAVRYGTLTKDSGYTLTLGDDDTVPTSIALTGATLTLPKSCTDTAITTTVDETSATFTVKTSVETFTVNADKSTFTNVDSIALTAGELTATTSTPSIYLEEKTVKVESGTVTVGINSDGQAYVGELDGTDNFKINNNQTFTMIDGKLFQVEGSTKKEVNEGFEDGVFTIDAWEVENIIAVEDTVLDLTNQTDSAAVYDSVSNPKIRYGKLTKNANGTFTLAADEGKETTAAGDIKTVAVADNADITVNFSTNVSVESGTITVNGTEYIGETLKIKVKDTSGTENTALYSGTVTINSSHSTVTDANDNTVTLVDNAQGDGKITAKAESGKFTEIGELTAGDTFTYGETTYTYSTCGMLKNGTICEDMTDTTVPISKLTSTYATVKWIKIIAPADGVLATADITETCHVYDNADLPTKKLADLKVDGTSLKLTADEEALADSKVDEITTVTVATNSTLNVNFITQVSSSGTVTVNKQVYAGTGALTIDTTSDSSTLYEGTITLDATNKSATATKDAQALTYKSGDGFTAKAEDGKFTTISGFGEGDSFTFDDTYTYSAKGLLNSSGEICEDLAGETVDLTDLATAKFTTYLTPKDGVLDLTAIEDGTYPVYDSGLTTKLGTLTAAESALTFTSKAAETSATNITDVKIANGDDLTVDFVTQVSVPIDSTVTVNKQSYAATTKLTVSTTEDTSTLTSGTVTLNEGDYVTPTDNEKITATKGDFTVTVNDGEVTIGGIADEESFTAGEMICNKIEGFLYRNDNGDRRVYNGDITGGSITLSALKGTEDWGILKIVVDGKLTIKSDTLTEADSALLIDNDLQVYGKLTVDENVYTLTKPDNATLELASITVEGVTVNVAPEFVDVPLTANNSVFSDITLTNSNNSFAVDATDTPKLDNVKSLTLTKGNVAGVVGQTVTAGDYTVTPSTIGDSLTIDSAQINGLSEGDAFTLGGDDYEYIKDVGLFNSTDKTLVTKGHETSALTFADMVETQLIVQADGVVTLADMTGTDAVVVDSLNAPTTIYGNVNKSDSTYVVDFATKVKVAAGTVTVNDKAYVGTTALTINTTEETSNLYNGTVTLDTGSNVTVVDRAIEAVEGDGITVEASNGTATIFTKIDTDDAFTVDGTKYQLNSAGLYKLDGSNYVMYIGDADVLTTGEITLAQLDSDDWGTLLTVPTSGVFEITSDTLDNVDDSAPLVSADRTVRYGKLTKTVEDAYTLTDAGDTLDTIKITGVIVELEPGFASSKIIANGTDVSDITLDNDNDNFTVTYDDDDKLPVFGNVASFTLGSGDVVVETNQTVTTGSNVFTPTEGSMVVNSKSVSDIGEGETFTLNDDDYKLLDDGTLFNITNSKLVTKGYSDGTLTFKHSEKFALVPTAGGVLDLTVATEDGTFDVLDTEVSKIVGQLVVNNGVHTLDITDEESGIDTVKIADGFDLTVGFDVKVSVPTEASATVNGNEFVAVTDIVVDALEDGETATLTSGTVKLAPNASVTVTDSDTITATGGDYIIVKVRNSIITIGEMTMADTFSIDGEVQEGYAVTDIGLIRTDDGYLWTGEKDYTEGSISTADLEAYDNWTRMIVADSGNVGLDGDTLEDEEESVVFVDNIDEPTVTYGTFSLVDPNATDDEEGEDGEEEEAEDDEEEEAEDESYYTFTKSSDDTLPSSITVTTIAVTFDKAFADVEISTVNEDESTTTFVITTIKNNASTFTVEASDNAADISEEVTALSLSAGYVVAKLKQTVETTDHEIKVTALADESTLIIGVDGVGNLTAGDEFTFDGDKYKYIDGVGLFNSTDKTLVITEVDDDGLLGYDWEEAQVLVPTSAGLVNLTSVTAAAVVLDSKSSPATKYATLTVDEEGNFTLAGEGTAADTIKTVSIAADTTYTVDFETNVKSAAGTVNVNEVTYVGTTALEIATTAETSTLTSGTVTLAADEEVTITDGDTIAATDGDNITVQVKSGTVTIGGLNEGDVFNVGDAEYTVGATGPVNADGQLWVGSDYTAGITTTELETADNWASLLVATNGALEIDDSTTEGSLLIVDDEYNPTVVYGTLTYDADTAIYTFTTDNATDGAALTSIAVDDTVVTFDADFASVAFAANSSVFSGITLGKKVKTFTVTATTDNPSLSSDVTALTLEDGTVTALAKQVVTVGDKTITPTTVDSAVISTEDISNLTAGDVFTVATTEDEETTTATYSYIDGVGLFNSTDKTLVDDFEGTYTFDDSETQVIAPNKKGVLDISAVDANAHVFDSTSSPTTKYATLTVEDDAITLAGEDSAGTYITSVTIADGADLTIDFETSVTAPADASVTVNENIFNAETEITIATTEDDSTLTSGTVILASGGSVTITDGDTITAKSNASSALRSTSDVTGVLTVTVSGTTVTLSDLTANSTFTVGDETYTVSAAGVPLNSDGQIWHGDDLSDGVTIAELADDTNWADMFAASNGKLIVKSDTLDDGAEVVLVDNVKNPSVVYGTLEKDTDDEADTYTLTKDDDQTALEGITVNGTVMKIDNDLAKVDITAIASENSATFTVEPDANEDYFTVDATGTTPEVTNIDSIAVAKGNVTTDDDVDVEPATQEFSDGTEVTIDGQSSDSDAKLSEDEEGNKTISGLEEGTKVTVDGKTYETPEGCDTLKYTAEDGWYFEGYTLDAYTVTVDADGNVTVDDGVQFSLVVSSGRTLDEDATIQFAADVFVTPITVNNKGTTAININDKDGDALAAGVGKVDDIVFAEAGTTVSNLNGVAGATFTLDKSQLLTATDEATITASTDDVAIIVGKHGKTLTATNSAAINAPTDTELVLSAGTYDLNGVELKPSGTTQATLTANGVTVNLEDNDPLIFNGMTLGSTGTATFDADDNVTLSSGATATNAAGNTITFDGTIVLDEKTITTDEQTTVTATKRGLTVGDEALTVTGDTDGYSINIVDGDIVGVANIGSTNGVTIGGLSDATVLTDKASSLTVDKTFGSASGVTYTIEDGLLIAADDVTTISGDFSEGFTVNDTPYTITGGTVTVNAEGDVVTGAGTFAINGKTYTTTAQTTFDLNNNSVAGASLADGTFAIHQDESGFAVNDDSLTLSDNSAPVSLGIAGGSVVSAAGVDGAISGLDDVTVANVNKATINGTPIAISNSTVDVEVVDGSAESIDGLDNGANVTSAPTMTLTTAENGTFNFVNGEYTIRDTDDASVDFLTDADSNVINIANFVGSVTGDGLADVAINGEDFASTSEDVVVGTDGEIITTVDGLQDGDAVSGDLDDATVTLPEGTVSINGAAYGVAGDEDGVALSGGGSVIRGLAEEGIISFGEAGTYDIDGTTVDAAAGDAYTANRDGVFKINPDLLPIRETTPADDILALGESAVYVDSGYSSIEFIDGNNVALIDGASADVKTGTGNDSVVVRQGGKATVDVEYGDPVIVPTSGQVTLENYDGSDAAIQTFDYSDIPAAIANNNIKFGDGRMTMGDAVITFDTDASPEGATLAELIDADGDTVAVGFTHTDGGELDISGETDPYILKGNYAARTSDTTKSDGSEITGGRGNDTLLIGAGDTADGGRGNNQIYITDPALRDDGATIILGDAGKSTVHNFDDGFSEASDAIKISDPSALKFGYGSDGFTMRSGDAQLTIDDLTPSEDMITMTAADELLKADAPYELKLEYGGKTYNAAFAQDGMGIGVTEDSEANVFFGNGGGITFSEYEGSVAVNLDNTNAFLNGEEAAVHNISQVALGSGNSTLLGASNTSNTLIAGTGNGSIWSDSGNDLMVGNTDEDKTGETTFFYNTGDGRDTISNFDFMENARDAQSDMITLGSVNDVSNVYLTNDGDVVIAFNDGTNDLLTIEDAEGKNFRLNDLVLKVDDVIEYDGYTDCYIGGKDNSTLSVGADMGDVEIWLNDEKGTLYLGGITVIDASEADGSNTLFGDGANNLIIGGTGTNSIWGAAGNDTLTGGTGQNTFFFMAGDGNDTIYGAHDGDIVDLGELSTSQLTAGNITASGVSLELSDGSKLEVQSNAAIEYRTADGTYTADHSTGQWNRKE